MLEFFLAEDITLSSAKIPPFYRRLERILSTV
jgi:hypothetical protein